MKDSLIIECLCADDRQHLIMAVSDDEFGKGFKEWLDAGNYEDNSYYHYIDLKIFTQFEFNEFNELNKPEDLIGKSINIHDGLEVNLDYPEDEIKEIIGVYKASNYFPISNTLYELNEKELF